MADEADHRLKLKTIMTDFNKAKSYGNRVSLADLIVLGGNAAIEKAAAAAGTKNLKVPFTAGRVDATQESTDIASFENLNPQGDGFRNYRNSSGWSLARTEELLVDKAQQLTLTAPELTVLVGGMRALNTNFDGSSNGILTSRPGTLTNDFFTICSASAPNGLPILPTNCSSARTVRRASRSGRLHALI
jgi:catalase-peroxidase